MAAVPAPTPAAPAAAAAVAAVAEVSEIPKIWSCRLKKKKNKTMKEFTGEVKVEDGRSKWRKEKKIIKNKKKEIKALYFCFGERSSRINRR